MASNKKHPWEEEAWFEMRNMLDDQMPSGRGAFSVKHGSIVLLLFLLLSIASWSILDFNSVTEQELHHDLLAGEISNNFPYSYEIANSQNSNKWQTRFGDLAQVEGMSRAELPPAYRANLERTLARSTQQLFDFSFSNEKQISFSGVFTSLSLPISDLVSQTELHSISAPPLSILKQAGISDNQRFRPFIDGHVQYQDGRFWGVGMFLGTSFSGNSSWEASLSVGYQYLKRRTLHANENLTVPLVLPGVNPGEIEGPIENGGADLDLPSIQVHGHRVGVQGSLRRKLAGNFSLGAVGRVSVDWASLSPNMENNPLRYHYPDLSFNKTEFTSQHLHVGAGVESVYAYNHHWKLYVRGLITKQFAGLNSNRNYLESHLWTLESGVYYRF